MREIIAIIPDDNKKTTHILAFIQMNFLFKMQKQKKEHFAEISLKLLQRNKFFHRNRWEILSFPFKFSNISPFFWKIYFRLYSISS